MPRRAGIAFLFMLLGCAAPLRVQPKEPVAMSDAGDEKCLETIEVDQTQSVLAEQRVAGKPLPDFPRHFEAVHIDPATYAPVKVTQSFRIDGQPLLWFTPDRGGVVVDARWLTDLTAVDATRLADGETARVGALTPAGRGKLTNREVVRFLIRAGVVRTYVHIGASLCLEAEKAVGSAYEATFFGEHVYYTNKRYTVRYRFSVRVTEGGEITVTGV